MALLDLLNSIGWDRVLAMGSLVLVGACLQGVSGLGFAMFASPLAALWFPELVPGPMLVLSCPLALMTGMRDRRSIEWPMARLALVGRVVGTGVAAFSLTLLSAQTLSVLFAVLILSGVGLSLSGWRVMPTLRNTTIAGLASGVMGTITSVGAPPFAIAMQHMPADRLRGTFGAIFFIGSAVSIAALTAVGRMGAHEFLISLILMPWMLAGFLVSGLLKGRVPAARVRALLLGMAGLGALGILARVLTGH